MSADETEGEAREFCWLDDAADIVIESQSAVAIYANLTGSIVVRQRDDFSGDDAWVSFRPEHAAAVARAILETAARSCPAVTPEPTLVSGGATSCGTTKPKDPAAAERQRRRRERKKKESTIEPDLLDRDGRDEHRDSVTGSVTDRDVTRDEDAA